MYKANIYFDATEDSYENGELGGSINSWNEELTADTTEKLKEKIEAATYTEWKDISQNDANGYEFASEYWASYLANEYNEGDATEREIIEWRNGKLKLFAIQCHILVSEVTEKKAVL